MRCVLLGAAILLAAPAQAELLARFTDAAPADRLTLSHAGGCPLQDTVVTIDLAPAGLILDVTGSGAGVAVFQPLVVERGADRLAAAPDPRDGDTSLRLSVARLASGDEIAMTLDLDEAASATPTRVSGAEMAGAVLRIEGAEAVFDSNGEARLALLDCIS